MKFWGSPDSGVHTSKRYSANAEWASNHAAQASARISVGQGFTVAGSSKKAFSMQSKTLFAKVRAKRLLDGAIQNQGPPTKVSGAIMEVGALDNRVEGKSVILTPRFTRFTKS